MKLNLIKFGGKWCGACNYMARQRVLEQFGAVTSDVQIVKHEVPDPADDIEDPIADDYDVMSMPTLIFEDPATGAELARHEGGLSLRDLRALYETAKQVASGEKKRPKKLEKYGARVGGYEGVRSRAEKSIEGAPNNDEAQE